MLSVGKLHRLISANCYWIVTSDVNVFKNNLMVSVAAIVGGVTKFDYGAGVNQFRVKND